jgi:hypothetical protein
LSEAAAIRFLGLRVVDLEFNRWRWWRMGWAELVPMNLLVPARGRVFQQTSSKLVNREGRKKSDCTHGGNRRNDGAMTGNANTLPMK